MSFVAPVKADDDREDDAQWPKKNVVGRQELEVRIDKDHISFETAKIGSLADVNDSEDAEGLRVFYYLVQDLKVSYSSSEMLTRRSASSCPSSRCTSRSSRVSTAVEVLSEREGTDLHLTATSGVHGSASAKSREVN